MIKEFDDMRYNNALEGNAHDLKVMTQLKEIKDKKDKDQ
jgi:hypothetical protein